MTADPSSETTPLSPPPNRIRGWLIVPAVGLVAGCVMGVANLALALSRFPDAVAVGYGGMLIRALAVDAGQVALTIAATIRFFGRKRNAPMIVIALFVAGILIDAFLLVAKPIEDRQLLGAGSGTAFVRSTVISCIWIAYFSISKRVKATFVN